MDLEWRSASERHPEPISRLSGRLVLVALVGCGGAPATPALMAQSGDVSVTVSQLRSQDYDFSAHFAAQVTACANQIIAATKDDTIRSRALRWKMNAVPAARGAAFHHDPLVALYDLWSLTLQQRNYFTEGDGATMFADHQQCAVSTSYQLVNDAIGLARKVTTSGDVSETQNRLEDWARLNPIDGLFVRRSAASDMSALAPQAPHKGLQAVESLEETSRDLTDRITILSGDLPREARWQAEYLINALFEERLETSAHEIVSTFGRLNTLLDQIEPLINDPRDGLIGAIERERTAIVEAVSYAGESLQQGVESERLAFRTSMHEEVDWAIGKLDATARGLIDYLFLRAVQLVLMLLAVSSVVYFLLRRRPPSARRKTTNSNDA